ncbi:MAG: tRNA (adenosine(37)-N6)-threonylcarbamoyltransferase complex dimerization subunit type 1 TsaB [Bacteroidales bacterium]|nr:tRNA (adenosine(37)-N6)-threonylcarbamoyltransferase complex dimerization subunit type 1 TsaB [Bacteroidales bacterium]
MSKILCLETATDVCSVCISENGSVISARESGNERSHALQLAVFIDEILKESGIEIKNLDAVAISRGPGSYTGLRIGVSTAKGLCYGSGKPLISISTLQSMCYGVPESYMKENKLENFYFAPMLDARRMEVYSAVYSKDKTVVEDISAVIIEDDSFNKYLDEKPVVFFGDGAEKTKEILNHPNAFFFDDFKHSSQFMNVLAHQKFEEEKFEDVAYFEPFYLKDFITTTSTKNILFPGGKK